MIVSAEKDFWENFIVKNVPPPLDGSTAAEKYVKERYKDKIKNYFELKKTIKELEVQAKEIENNVKLELGEEEIGYTPDYEQLKCTDAGFKRNWF